MSIKKQTIITQDLPDDSKLGKDDEDDDLELDETSVQIANLRTQFGPQGLLLKVYKIIPGSKPQFCFKSQDNSDIEEEIQMRYGGGKYAIRAFSEGKLLDTIYTDVAEPSMNPGNGTGPKDGDINKLIFTMMQQQNQQLTNMMMAALGRPGNIGTQSNINDVLLEHVLNNKAATGTGPDSIVGKILERALDSLDAKTEGATDWKSEAIKGVREIVTGALPVVAAHLGAVPNGAVTMNPHPGSNGNGGGQIPPNPMLGAPVMSDDDMIKDYLLKVKPAILAGMLPADLALDWIFANSQRSEFQPILKFALTKSVDDIIKIDPDLANTPYKEWIGNVIKGIKKAYEEQGQE